MICKKLDDGCDNGVGRCVDESQIAGTTFLLQGDFLLSIVENIILIPLKPNYH